MLVLSRKQGETICIGNDIEISVSQVSGKRVKLAISAPRDVSIRRSELADTSIPSMFIELVHDSATAVTA